MRWNAATTANSEPVSVDLVKSHLRISTTSEDELLAVYIAAARRHAEQKAGVLYAPATVTVTLPEFPAGGGALLLPVGPYSSLTSFQYYASGEDTLTTVSASDYRVISTDTLHPRLELVSGAAWPAVEPRSDAVKIIYSAGYTSGTIPADAKNWILMATGRLYDNREAASDVTVFTPQFVDGLLDSSTDPLF